MAKKTSNGSGPAEAAHVVAEAVVVEARPAAVAAEQRQGPTFTILWTWVQARLAEAEGPADWQEDLRRAFAWSEDIRRDAYNAYIAGNMKLAHNLVREALNAMAIDRAFLDAHFAAEKLRIAEENGFKAPFVRVRKLIEKARNEDVHPRMREAAGMEAARMINEARAAHRKTQNRAEAEERAQALEDAVSARLGRRKSREPKQQPANGPKAADAIQADIAARTLAAYGNGQHADAGTNGKGRNGAGRRTTDATKGGRAGAKAALRRQADEAI